MNRRTGTFEEFKDYTLAVARGERPVDPAEPKIWGEPTEDNSPLPSVSVGAESSHYIHSMLRERIVEHVFVGKALQRLWNLGARDVEVLRSEFDAGGYDLVMTYGSIVRHIQLKTVMQKGKAVHVTVSLKLMEKPSGCVIWIVVDPKLELKSYRWFGGAPGQPLRDISEFKLAKNPRANAKGKKLEKRKHRIVPLRHFQDLDTLDAVLDRLFGPLP
jgi:hypothetical protein